MRIPITLEIDAEAWLSAPHDRTEYRARALRGLAVDAAALEDLIAGGDPVIYRVDAIRAFTGRDGVALAVTSIEPGHVGEEYFMTRGHAHVPEASELYLGLAGTGVVVMSHDHELRCLALARSRAVLIPAGWTHRAVNIGVETFRFLAVYSASVVNDYATVARNGMGCIVVRAPSGYRVVASG